MLELGETIVSCADVSVFYGDTCAINNISIDIEKQSVTAFIGPSWDPTKRGWELGS